MVEKGDDLYLIENELTTYSIPYNYAREFTEHQLKTEQPEFNEEALQEKYLRINATELLKFSTKGIIALVLVRDHL